MGAGARRRTADSRVARVLLAAGGGATLFAAPAAARAAAPSHASAFGSGPVVMARASEPVVINGRDIPSWSRLAATGVAAAFPSGVTNADGGDNVRSAHNGTLTVPPDPRTGVNPDQIAAYRFDGSSWAEVPVQVDQMYLYHLANGHSSFSVYSGTDQELTYAWNPTAHAVGEEAWKKVFGGISGITNPAYTDPNPCTARYQLPGAAGQIELTRAIANGVVSPPKSPGIPADDYTQAMQDPVNTAAGTPQLNDDDQIAMMAGDAGVQAPGGTLQPTGTVANNGQEVTILDPTSSADGSAQLSYIYLFLQPGGSHFNSSNGYVQMTRGANADQWIDRYSFSPASTEKLGVSNTSYGANLSGQVCVTAADNDANPKITTANGQPRASIDRQPSDAVTLTTPTYAVDASGRWMVRKLRVVNPGTTTYGPNLISRWKGRAFQSSPDSSVSVVGFEDEQVNWELNSALLGWRVGPVRAIREVWDADSGTNVTKVEIYYRDSYTFQYHVRVHPIPTDGLYTSWDFNYGQVSTYYNQLHAAGVPIDGTNSHSVGEVDSLPVTNQPAFVNSCDPTFDLCSALNNPEEIAGTHGSLVYVAAPLSSQNNYLPDQALLPQFSTLVNPEVVPYYRDDACFDDGTGDGPVPRPYPGDPSTDAKVQNGYVAYWKAHGAPSSIHYSDLKCQPPAAASPGYQQPSGITYQTLPFQGAIGEMGLHFFFTADSDNAFGPVPIDEIDAEQQVYPVPSSGPANLISATASAAGHDYGLNVVAPLQTVVRPFGALAAAAPEAPISALLPVIAGLVAVPVLRRRWVRRGA